MKASQEQAEDHTFMHCPEEECGSVVTISSIVGPPVVDKAGQVLVGKRSTREGLSRLVHLYLYIYNSESFVSTR